MPPPQEGNERLMFARSRGQVETIGGDDRGERDGEGVVMEADEGEVEGRGGGEGKVLKSGYYCQCPQHSPWVWAVCVCVWVCEGVTLECESSGEQYNKILEAPGEGRSGRVGFAHAKRPDVMMVVGSGKLLW